MSDKLARILSMDGGAGIFEKLVVICISSYALLGAASATGSTITGTRNFQIVARLTGPQGSNSINPTWQVGVGGTDLGHMVNHRGKTYFLFGDTFASEASAGSGGPDWRQNVMAYSTDVNPVDGITFDGWITRPNGTARQVIVPGSQPVTYIPTGAISVGDRIYAWYMHVTDWDQWTLGHAGLAKWREGDSQFSIVPNYRFQNPAGGAYTTGQGAQGGNFGMVAASFRSPLENSGDEFLYIWGTPGGREGGVKLARVLPNQIENLSAYRYFDGVVGGVPQWTTTETNGEKLIQSGVGEMSVMYNEAVGAWTLMYITGGAQPDFALRQAPNPWGPWSDPVTVARFNQAPGLYSPYMNPLYVEDGGKTLYFTMSLWDPYDVYLAKVTLDVDNRVRWIAGAGAWSDASNWNPGLPAVADQAVISNAGNVMFNSIASVRRLEVGSAAGSGGSLVISGGALNVVETLEVFGNGNVSLAAGALAATTISNTRGGSFAFTSGTLAVDAFNGNLVNVGGALAPDQAATSIAGNYTQLFNATIVLDVGGRSLGSQYDALKVTGALSLAGELIVSLIDGFVPAPGDRFDILDFASLTGEFAAMSLPSLPAGMRWDASQIYVTGELSVGLSGDFNDDGQVNDEDFAEWCDRFGVDVGSDGDDFLVWQSSYGLAVEAPTLSIPEPASSIASLVALALLAVGRRPWVKGRGAIEARVAHASPGRLWSSRVDLRGYMAWRFRTFSAGENMPRCVGAISTEASISSGFARCRKRHNARSKTKHIFRKIVSPKVHGEICSFNDGRLASHSELLP